MKTLLFLLMCIVASSFGIATADGAMHTFCIYSLMAATVVSAVVLATGVTD